MNRLAKGSSGKEAIAEYEKVVEAMCKCKTKACVDKQIEKGVSILEY